MPLLEVRGLVKYYGRRKVVGGVDFQVDAGEVVGLLGPNGAGKTTSFRMTTGQITPHAGTVWFNDGGNVLYEDRLRRFRVHPSRCCGRFDGRRTLHSLLRRYDCGQLHPLPSPGPTALATRDG